MAEVERSGSDFVSAVARAMAVLECFTTEAASRQQGRLTLTDAARLTDLSRGTARRLLLTLSALHYVDTDGKFFWLTPKMVNLSRGFILPLGLGESSRAVLIQLTQALDESASIGILDGPEIVYVERVEVRRIYSSRIANGTRLPAAASSIGRVLLARMSDDELNRWLDNYPLAAHTPKSITDRSAFCAEIDKVRRQGYALCDEQLELGIRSIAVPIASKDGRVNSALNTSTIPQRHSVEELESTFLPKLKAASIELSHTMAW